MASDNASTIVAVTGGSGYIAGHCIHQLLEKGYTVRATVRDKSNATKVKHLTDSFPGVQLYEADLLSEGSFDEFCAGAHIVLHTASPFQLTIEDPQRDLVDPAVKGTLNVLRSAKKAGTVRRVVVTSSCAAVAPNKPPEDPEYVFTEDDWNDDASLTEAPYRFSKAEAERAAWKFAEEEGLDVVVINPSFVLGPPFSARTDSTSVKFVLNCLNGGIKAAGGTGPACFGAVDVRDIARAHIAAFENEGAKGRYIMSSSEGVSHFELATFLREDPAFEGFPVPDKQKEAPARRPKYDHSKAERELGITFTDVRTAVTDMGKYLVETGMVAKPASE
mmetsp:Transcript_15165/g.52697  ORF Transcript_15165/g.52697 Transcript_15165/m.52697 type:complete len:333 (-) Transcript_15165:128-1126(-)